VSRRGLAKPFTEELFEVYGFLFRFCTNRPDARRSIARLYERFRCASRGETGVEALLEGDRIDGFRWRVGESAGTTSDLPGALWSLEAALCQAIIRSQRRCMAVHASAICAGNSATLLVGRSGAGKTTLSLALARRGLAVATDDVALVEPETLNVFPIPRCFHLDDQSVTLLEADGLRFPQSWKRFSFMVPSDLGVRAIGPCRAQLLVFVSAPPAEQPLITPISQAEMVARLLSETGQGPLEDPEIVRGLCRLAGGVSCHSLIPGPLAETADALAYLALRRKY
jgi:hypothetical protein